MTPLRFVREGRELFALHLEPSAGAPPRPCGVLLCNPFGQESIRAHRLYRVLSERLAAAGFHVLRLDYYGTGDSAGDDSEFDLDGAVGDTVAAGNELLQRSGMKKLSCLGLRLGGNIAALASSQWAEALDHLVLFEPMIDGASYLRDLQRANAETMAEMFGARWRIDSALRQYNLPNPGEETLGFALTARCKAQITERINWQKPWPGCADYTFIVTPHVGAIESWTSGRDVAASPHMQVIASNSDIDWATNSALNSAIVPREWVNHALDSLTEIADA